MKRETGQKLWNEEALSAEKFRVVQAYLEKKHLNPTVKGTRKKK